MKREADVCRIWQVPLSESSVAQLPLHLLQQREHERAARLRDPRDRQRFMGCRAALRALLGECLGRDPASLEFLRGEHGRPELAPDRAIQFNVTHSGEIGLIAIAHSAPLGVDVEALREMKNALALARRYFTPTECAAVESVDASMRSAEFLACWTRKEALLKSAGHGLTLDPRSVETGSGPDEIALEWPLNSHSQVLVRSIDVGADHRAACVTAAHVARIELLRFMR